MGEEEKRPDDVEWWFLHDLVSKCVMVVFPDGGQLIGVLDFFDVGTVVVRLDDADEGRRGTSVLVYKHGVRYVYAYRGPAVSAGKE